MLRILKEHTRTVDRRSIPLLLNSRDIQTAKLYTPDEIAALIECFCCDVPYRASKLIVNFSEKDAISEYMGWNDYWLKWEYNRDRQSIPTLILNFAGAHRPDANQFPIAYGQERSLLENSTLLATLENPEAHAFYLFQQAATDGMRSDAMLLSPYVEFFSVDGVQQEKSQLAAVLSAVPPRFNGDSEAVKKALERRIRAMLLVAAKEGYRRLILGAWGCGSAGNDPELVASLFEKVIREHVHITDARGEETLHSWQDFFDSITFPVPPGSASAAFKNHFSDFYRAEREERHNRIRAEIASDREKYLSAIKGSLVGGAIGDALGYPVEFMPYNSIIRHHGEGGIQHYEKNLETGLALISDDTQMTLFTAAGMLVGETRGAMRGVAGSMESYIYYAYRDWYFCQCSAEAPGEDGIWKSQGHSLNTSWLSYLPEMQQRRAPGNTCLSALGSGDSGTLEEPINHSKGCGGIMRIAPVALFYNHRAEKKREWLVDICSTAAKAAALTHGHPLGYMPAAALAHIISRAIFGGCPYENELHGILKECRELMRDMFEGEPYLPKMLSLMERAEELAANDKSDAENIESLGGGWVAEETLAIAIYCCLRYSDDFSKAVIAAVNHSGDSDSTGAVTGNIMGAWLGYEKIDPVWLKDLELRNVIEEVATDLCDHCRMSEFGDYRDKDWERKYINFGKPNQES
ncbi:MAG: TIGR02452 family protein [Clostridiales bacterium]|nr:TIGR02452 family protein [Clostridiales bacterium]